MLGNEAVVKVSAIHHFLLAVEKAFEWDPTLNTFYAQKRLFVPFEINSSSGFEISAKSLVQINFGKFSRMAHFFKSYQIVCIFPSRLELSKVFERAISVPNVTRCHLAPFQNKHWRRNHGSWKIKRWICARKFFFFISFSTLNKWTVQADPSDLLDGIVQLSWNALESLAEQCLFGKHIIMLLIILN